MLRQHAGRGSVRKNVRSSLVGLLGQTRFIPLTIINRVLLALRPNGSSLLYSSNFDPTLPESFEQVARTSPLIYQTDPLPVPGLRQDHITYLFIFCAVMIIFKIPRGPEERNDSLQFALSHKILDPILVAA